MPQDVSEALSDMKKKVLGCQMQPRLLTAKKTVPSPYRRLTPLLLLGASRSSLSPAVLCGGLRCWLSPLLTPQHLEGVEGDFAT